MGMETSFLPHVLPPPLWVQPHSPAPPPLWFMPCYPCHSGSSPALHPHRCSMCKRGWHAATGRDVGSSHGTGSVRWLRGVRRGPEVCRRGCGAQPQSMV